MRVLVAGDLAIVVEGRLPALPPPGSNTILTDKGVYVSGVGANVAFNLRRLGVEVALAGAVGDDPFGKVIVTALRAREIGTDRIRRVDAPTSVFMVLVDANGERTMIGYRGANEHVCFCPDEITGDWLHISGYMLLNSCMRDSFREIVDAVSGAGIPLSIDLEGIADSSHRVDLSGTIVLCNRDDYREYFGRGALAAPPGVERLIVKAGAEGCFIVTSHGNQHIPPFATRVYDTTGAGDAFNAALIAARLHGLTWEEACLHANAAASLKVAAVGPYTALSPTRIREVLRGR